LRNGSPLPSGCVSSKVEAGSYGAIICHLNEAVARTSVDSDSSTQRKCFWLLLTILSLGAIFLPLGWGVVETLVSMSISWWVIYRSGIF
jgi:uncharacterized membrane protein